jgi:dihydroorotate dehydrogenase (NAD+) catalytic subunit
MALAPTSFYDPAKTFDDNFDNGPFPVSESDVPYANHGAPAYSFLGKQIYSPFGIAAGPLPNSTYVKYAWQRGFDVVCYKTQRSVPFPSNEFPNILYMDIDGDLTLEKATQPLVGRTTTNKPANKLSITNSFGNPSRGPEFWVDDIKSATAAKKPGQLLIVSVCGTIVEGASAEDYYDDFAHAAKLAAQKGVDAIELNLSCPNVATEGVLCYSHDAVVEVSRRAKAAVGDVPLIAKFGYFSPDQQALLEANIKDTASYLSGVSVINTISATIVNDVGEQALPGLNRLKSGVCGASVRWAGLDMVKRLKAIRETNKLDYEIIGVGGVMSPADFEAYREAGADLVQSATGAMWNPKLAQQIKEAL